MEARKKFSVKNNSSACAPRRVLSVVNLTAANFIQTPPKDKFSKFPVLKPKVSRRNSEIIRRPQQEGWIAHYKELVTQQLNQNHLDTTRQKKVTFSFCDFLKKKEEELKMLSESKEEKISPAKYHD